MFSTVLSKVNVFKIKKAVFTILNKEVRIYYFGVISTINKLLEKPMLVEYMSHEIFKMPNIDTSFYLK